jgi:hypothetical protein
VRAGSTIARGSGGSFHRPLLFLPFCRVTSPTARKVYVDCIVVKQYSVEALAYCQSCFNVAGLLARATGDRAIRASRFYAVAGVPLATHPAGADPGPYSRKLTLRKTPQPRTRVPCTSDKSREIFFC